MYTRKTGLQQVRRMKKKEPGRPIKGGKKYLRVLSFIMLYYASCFMLLALYVCMLYLGAARTC